MIAAHIELYDWLRAFHVVLAVIWVGGAVVLQILAVRILREDDPAKSAAFAGQVEWMGTRVFAPASGLLLLLGIWMVIEEPAWTFGQAWILVALAMFAYSFLSGVLYLGPQSGKLKRMYEIEGPAAPGAPALIRRLFLVSRIELVLLILIVFDMVLKPGL
ncbi:MAG TPA: DUF2269 family protein [Actinomycetota bacterium]|jgi:uncharacterized membrane protein